MQNTCEATFVCPCCHKFVDTEMVLRLTEVDGPPLTPPRPVRRDPTVAGLVLFVAGCAVLWAALASLPPFRDAQKKRSGESLTPYVVVVE